MIDENITFVEKGYYSTYLKPYSHKSVYAICEGENCEREGGRGRWVMFCQYRELCSLCAKKTKKFIENHREVHTRENLSEETLQKMSEIKKGENNPMYGRTGEMCPSWQGGITSDNDKIRNSHEYAKWRKAVFERDEYTCQECGDSTGGNLNAHHILPIRDWKEPRFSLNIKNGITLCEKCHDKTKWKEYEFFNKYFDIANGVGKHNN